MNTETSKPSNPILSPPRAGMTDWRDILTDDEKGSMMGALGSGEPLKEREIALHDALVRVAKLSASAAYPLLMEQIEGPKPCRYPGCGLIGCIYGPHEQWSRTNPEVNRAPQPPEKQP